MQPPEPNDKTNKPAKAAEPIGANMSDSEKPTFEWENDKDAGEIVKRFMGSKSALKESDPRIDVLIDMGILLGETDRVYFEVEKIEITRARTKEYVQYTVCVDDGLVFDTVYSGDDFDMGLLLHGPWVYNLAMLAKNRHSGNSYMRNCTKRKLLST